MSNHAAQLVYDRLRLDPTLSSLVGVYRSGPAIFAGPEVPDDVTSTLKYVWIVMNEVDDPNDTKTKQGRHHVRQIWCVCPNTGTWVDVTNIAIRVRRLLHRKPLKGSDSVKGDVNGYIADCRGPVPVDSDKSVVALSVTLDFRYTE